MATVIECPNCSKKLKLQAVPAGKKVRCPGCKEAFAPAAAAPSEATPAKKPAARAKPAAKAKPETKAKPAAKPKPKRRPAPVHDDYEDLGGDDLFDDELYGDDGLEDDYDEPPRRSQKAAKSGGRKSSAAKKGKKKAAASGSKKPLYIGIGVISAALVGGLVFMLVRPGGNDDAVAGTGGAGVDSSLTPANAELPADLTGADPAAMAAVGPGQAGGPGDSGGHDAPDIGGSSGHDAPGGAPAGATSAGGSTASAPASGGGSNSSVVSTQWLPANSEAVAQIDLARLVNGPLGQLLQNPMVTQPLEAFRQQTGFGPEDIQSVTVGAGGISQAISSGQKPGPNTMPVTAVIRASKSIELSQLAALIPRAQTVTEDGLTFIRIPENPPAAIWLADSTTAVVGIEKWVRQAAAGGSPPTGIDTALLDGTSAIQVVFSPADPNSVFRHPQLTIPDQLPPGVPPEAQRSMETSLALARTFLKQAKGLSIGFDLTNDLGFSAAARCMDAGGAQQLSTALNTAQEESKAQQEAQSQNVPPMFAPFVQLGKAMSDSFKLETTGDVCRFSMSAPGGGQQLATLGPMLIGPAIMQARAAAQQSAQRMSSQNNMKQIGLAMHNFHSVYKRFPNAAPAGPSGEKWLSWRVHLLPFLEHQQLYSQFALEEPWDSPTNRPLVEQMPDVFRSKNVTLETGKTLFQVPVGPGTAFEGQKGFGLRDFTDGTSNTVLIVEAAPDRAVFWTQPEDFPYNPEQPLDGLGGVEPTGFHAVFADGSLKFVALSAPLDGIKAIFTRNGGEIVPAGLFSEGP